MSKQLQDDGKATPAHGVQELIARIRDEGVQAANAEAERILEQALRREIELLHRAAQIADLPRRPD